MFFNMTQMNLNAFICLLEVKVMANMASSLNKVNRLKSISTGCSPAGLVQNV